MQDAVSLLGTLSTHADDNVAVFRGPPPGEKTRTMMIMSSFAYVACHQEKPQ